MHHIVCDDPDGKSERVFDLQTTLGQMWRRRLFSHSLAALIRLIPTTLTTLITSIKVASKK